MIDTLVISEINLRFPPTMGRIEESEERVTQKEGKKRGPCFLIDELRGELQMTWLCGRLLLVSVQLCSQGLPWTGDFVSRVAVNIHLIIRCIIFEGGHHDPRESKGGTVNSWHS